MIDRIMSLRDFFNSFLAILTIRLSFLFMLVHLVVLLKAIDVRLDTSLLRPGGGIGEEMGEGLLRISRLWAHEGEAVVSWWRVEMIFIRF